MKPNNKKQRPNYFQQNIQRLGENFLNTKNANELEVDSIRIFRDIARGNIDVERDGKYFLNTQFLECCITGASLKLNMHTINHNGVTLLVANGNNDPMTLAVLNNNKRCMEAYTIIYTNLNNIKITQDPNYLSVMANNLRNYRNNI